MFNPSKVTKVEFLFLWKLLSKAQPFEMTEADSKLHKNLFVKIPSA